MDFSSKSPGKDGPERFNTPADYDIDGGKFLTAGAADLEGVNGSGITTRAGKAH